MYIVCLHNARNLICWCGWDYFPFVQPIPVEDLVVEDVDDVDAKVGGSFRGSLSMSSSKCVPAVSNAEWIAICISMLVCASVEESS